MCSTVRYNDRNKKAMLEVTVDTTASAGAFPNAIPSGRMMFGKDMAGVSYIVRDTTSPLTTAAEPL